MSGLCHRIPPFLRILFRSAVVKHVKIVALRRRFDYFDTLIDFDKTRFDTGCAYVVGEDEFSHKPPYF